MMFGFLVASAIFAPSIIVGRDSSKVISIIEI